MLKRITNLHKRQERTKYDYRTQQPWAVEALKRDSYRCRKCRSTKLSLMVHHIDDSRKNGYKNMNNNLDNLITLCPRCHAVAHGQSLKFSHPNVVLIKELRDQNKTYQEIGNHLGITRQRVYQIMAKFYPLDKTKKGVYDMRMLRLNVNIQEQLHKDLDMYCKKNAIEKSELVRQLVRKEIYQDHSLERKEVASAS